jgi:hypothetical protein
MRRLLRPPQPQQGQEVLLGKYTMDALLLLLPGEAVLEEMVALAREGDDWLRAMSEAERSGDALESLLREVQEGARALTHTRVTSAQFVELLERAGGGGAKYIEKVGLVRLGHDRRDGINIEEAQKSLDATFVELAARLASLSSDYSAAAADSPAAAPPPPPSEQFQSFSRRLRDEEVMRLGEQQRHLQAEAPSSSEKLMAYLEERMAAASLATPSGADLLPRLSARRRMLSPEQEEEVQGKIFGGGQESEVGRPSQALRPHLAAGLVTRPVLRAPEYSFYRAVVKMGAGATGRAPQTQAEWAAYKILVVETPFLQLLGPSVGPRTVRPFLVKNSRIFGPTL